MKKIDLKLKSFKNFLSILFFTFSYIFSHSVINLFYLSTQSADYMKYKNYLSYFQGSINATNLEQGLSYFYLVSSMIEYNSSKNIFLNDELLYSFSIQSVNFIIYTFGLIGFYLLLRFYNFDFFTILLVLGLLNFFPPALSLRFVMKPEILGFALLPWIILSFEKFFKSKKYIHLFESIIFLSLLVSLKISISAMILIFISIKYFKKWLKISYKQILFSILAFVIFTSALLIENYNSNGYFLTQAKHDNVYDNKASPKVIFNVNLINLLKEPYQHTQKDSMIGIFLLDTFDDYFNLDWNFDKSSFKKYRKEFLKPSESNNFGIEIDSKNKVLQYSGPFSFYLNFLRQYVAIFLTVAFYIFLYKQSKKFEKYKLYIVSPLIGIFILIINNVFGFPSNNFDPLRGDTFKTFYIAIFLCLSFVFISSTILKEISKVKIFIIIFYVFSIIFILGFPKANNDELDKKLSLNNQVSIFCEINKPILKNSLFDTSNLNCENFQIEELNSDKLELVNKPFVNIFSIVFVILMMIKSILQELQKSYFKKYYNVEE